MEFFYFMVKIEKKLSDLENLIYRCSKKVIKESGNVNIYYWKDFDGVIKNYCDFLLSLPLNEMYNWDESQFSKDNCYELFLQLLPVFSDFIVFLNKMNFYLAYSPNDFSLSCSNIDFNSKYLHRFVMLYPDYMNNHIITQYKIENYLLVCKAYEYYAINRRCIYFTDEEELFINFCDDIKNLIKVFEKIYIDRYTMKYNCMNGFYSINFTSNQEETIKPNIFTKYFSPFIVDMNFYKNTVDVLSIFRKIRLVLTEARENYSNKFFPISSY